MRDAEVYHEPRRGDEIESWIKRWRDGYGTSRDFDAAWTALNHLLDDYRDHADTGTPLHLEIQSPPWR